MSDLIDRQSAIDWCLEGLNNLPSAELATNLQQSCNQLATDCISRQAAIDACIRVRELRAYDEIEEIKALPSAQPEPCEDDPRADVYYLAEKIGIHQLYDLVVKLRGEPEPCEDAVSRQAVYNVLDKMPVRGFKKDGETIHGLISLSQVNSAIINLPSVQPERKKGKWIEQEDYNGDTFYDCSACGNSWITIDGTPWENGMNYCPNCGADMRGEQDDGI